MILTDKLMIKEKYQLSEIPDFENKKTKVLWLRRQKMLASLLNVKSVSVQIRDIKYMIYSNNPHLVSLYAKFHLSNSNGPYDDNDYITISNSTNLNRSLIYALISTDWLLDSADVEKKSIEELQEECLNLQNKINELKTMKKNRDYSDIDNRIKLFEYRLSCLSELVLNKKKEESALSQNRVRSMAKI